MQTIPDHQSINETAAADDAASVGCRREILEGRRLAARFEGEHPGLVQAWADAAPGYERQAAMAALGAAGATRRMFAFWARRDDGDTWLLAYKLLEQ